MTEGRQRTRALKRQVLTIISSGNWESGLEELNSLPSLQVINTLISLFCETNEEIKWRVITATGIVVSRLADKDMESARIIVRRLMWSLNSESGGLGWGAPEAMGEIMACHEGLAREFAQILVSYATPGGDNFLEFPALQRGVMWGLGRLSQVRPEPVQDIIAELSFFLKSDDATVRGLATWVGGIVKGRELHRDIETLLGDAAEIQLYLNHTLLKRSVKELAGEALARMEAE